MKPFNKIFISLGVAAASLGLGSCVGDLDLMPTNPTDFTADKFAADPARYMDEVFGNIYASFATQGFTNDGKGPITQFNSGFGVFNRAIFHLEEVPTDEADWLSASDAEFGDLQYTIPTPSTVAIAGAYQRLTINITLCNDFIRTVNQGMFQLNTDELKQKAQEYVRQAKILRSGCYFYLIDLFGNVPYADEGTDVGAVPAQLKRTELFDIVTRTLEDISAEYNGNNQTRYGFVGLDAADALLVKFYLNAEVYTGTAMWDKCLAKCNEIIGRHKGKGFQGSGLCNNYHQNFSYNNDQFAIGGEGEANEILWTIPANNPELVSWGGATLLINGYLGEPKSGINGVKAVCDPSLVNCASASWSCMTGRREFVEVFDWDETYTQSPDQRVRFWYTAKQGFNINNDNIGSTDHYGNNGYLTIKYNNWYINDDGSIDEALSPVKLDASSSDYAMIRLAEVYLSAAEAALHGAGSHSDALTWVNYIRERAGLTPWQATELNLYSLEQERQRELYCENTRRTDLIRYGKFISGYTWSWKNKVRNGADLPAHYVLYPLPDFVCTGAGYTQNPGY